MISQLLGYAGYNRSADGPSERRRAPHAAAAQQRVDGDDDYGCEGNVLGFVLGKPGVGDWQGSQGGDAMLLLLAPLQQVQQMSSRLKSQVLRSAVIDHVATDIQLN